MQMEAVVYKNCVDFTCFCEKFTECVRIRLKSAVSCSYSRRFSEWDTLWGCVMPRWSAGDGTYIREGTRCTTLICDGGCLCADSCCIQHTFGSLMLKRLSKGMKQQLLTSIQESFLGEVILQHANTVKISGDFSLYVENIWEIVVEKYILTVKLMELKLIHQWKH